MQSYATCVLCTSWLAAFLAPKCACLTLRNNSGAKKQLARLSLWQQKQFQMVAAVFGAKAMYFNKTIRGVFCQQKVTFQSRKRDKIDYAAFAIMF